MIWKFFVSVLLMTAAIAIGAGASANPSASDYPSITDVGPCLEQPFFCLGGEVPADLYATLIDLKGNLCPARTSKHATTNFGNGQGSGTQLTKLECKDPENYIVVVLSTRKGFVTDFEWLNTEKVDDPNQIHYFAKLLMNADKFSLDQARFTYAEGPYIKALKHPHPSSDFFSIEFHSCPGPLYLIQDSKIAGNWAESSYESEIRYFRLNQKYYIETCAGHCESDCGSNYVDVFAALEKASKFQPEKKSNSIK